MIISKLEEIERETVDLNAQNELLNVIEIIELHKDKFDSNIVESGEIKFPEWD